MDKEKVLDYVMNSPGNSNRAVLSGMLDESGGGDNVQPIIFTISDTNTVTCNLMPDEVFRIYPDYENIAQNTNIPVVCQQGQYTSLCYIIYFSVGMSGPTLEFCFPIYNSTQTNIIKVTTNGFSSRRQ
jgi:hypothetical protein